MEMRSVNALSLRDIQSICRYETSTTLAAKILHFVYIIASPSFKQPLKLLGKYFATSDRFVLTILIFLHGFSLFPFSSVRACREKSAHRWDIL